MQRGTQGWPPSLWQGAAAVSALANVLLLTLLALTGAPFGGRDDASLRSATVNSAAVATILDDRFAHGRDARPTPASVSVSGASLAADEANDGARTVECNCSRSPTDASITASLTGWSPEVAPPTEVAAPEEPRLNAAIVYFAGAPGSEPQQNLLVSLRLLDVMFNDRFGYPVFVFYLDSDRFSATIELARNVSRSSLTFVALPSALPAHVDRVRFRKAKWKKNHRLSYKHMCNFFAGGIFRHPALLPFRYIWRLDPDSTLLSPISYDVFRFVGERDIKFGYVENQMQTSTPGSYGLSKAFAQFVAARSITLRWWSLDGWKFTSTDGPYLTLQGLFNTHSVVMDAQWFRSGPHYAWYNYVDQLGGIYYERWADHQIITMSLMMFANSSEIHRFRDWSYRHAHVATTNSFVQLPEVGHSEPVRLSDEVFEFRNGDGGYVR